jgi:hypothetical protein
MTLAVAIASVSHAFALVRDFDSTLGYPGEGPAARVHDWTRKEAPDACSICHNAPELDTGWGCRRCETWACTSVCRTAAPALCAAVPADVDSGGERELFGEGYGTETEETLPSFAAAAVDETQLDQTQLDQTQLDATQPRTPALPIAMPLHRSRRLRPPTLG